MMLSDILSEPKLITTISAPALSKIIAEARYHNMLAQLKHLCIREAIWDQLPLKAREHLEAAELKYVNQRQCLENESQEFYLHLNSLNISWVYLKGAAYHLSNIDDFRGRLMGDIDILVSEGDLPKVESKLSTKGWIQAHVNNHDEKFYREWSQEIPPLRHIERRTELDLHFNILPKTLRQSPSPEVLMQHTVNISNQGTGPKVFSPPAMVIHSAIHLFYESEYSKGLRDLFDLYILFSSNASDEGFWRQLIEIQDQMGNADSVYLAIRYCHLVFNFLPPAFVIEYYNKSRPDKLTQQVLDFAYIRVFSFSYPENRKFGHDIAELFLYWRGHFKRMPIYLLIPHLTNKVLTRFNSNKKEEELII
ncbi:nucleotidyltransferase domain-containing protein [Vibrio hannami]|uniref:nucleotidyltransferase domain-containing protein n=1 Tax=Vibrio hannami TaxID=2717094 RepID=UPI003EB97C32